MNKICSKCKQLKPLDAFGPSKKGKLGKKSICRECDAAYSKARYAANPAARRKSIKAWQEKNRAHCLYVDRERYYKNRKRILARCKTIPATVRNKYLKTHRTKYPEKAAAWCAVRYALKTGKLTRLACIICGKPGEAHHLDYTKPLEITWLCKLHHETWHRLFLTAA